MNTFGLKRNGFNSFWLGGIGEVVQELWNDAVRFSATIIRKLIFRVEF